MRACHHIHRVELYHPRPSHHTPKVPHVHDTSRPRLRKPLRPQRNPSSLLNRQPSCHAPSLPERYASGDNARMKRLATAFVLGLLAAAAPLIATSGQCPQTLAADAPRYLMFVSDESAHGIRCTAGSRVTFERVRSIEAVTTHLYDEAIAGVIVDRETNATLPREAVGNWASTGSGRAVLGLGLRRAIDPIAMAAAQPTTSRNVFEIPTEDPRRPGLQSISRVYFKSCGSSDGDGADTLEYSGKSPLIALLVDRQIC